MEDDPNSSGKWKKPQSFRQMEDDIKFITQMKDNINFSRKWKTTSILRRGHGKHFPKKESILGADSF